MNLDVSTEKRNDLSFEDEAERQRVEHGKASFVINFFFLYCTIALSECIFRIF